MTLNLENSTNPLYEDKRGRIVYIELKETDTDEYGETTEEFIGFLVTKDVANRIYKRIPKKLHWLDPYMEIGIYFTDGEFDCLTVPRNLSPKDFDLVSHWTPEKIVEVKDDYFC